MPVDDCIVPLRTPLLKAGARCGALPSLFELDLYASAQCKSERSLACTSGRPRFTSTSAKENLPGQDGAETFSALSLQEPKDVLTRKPERSAKRPRYQSRALLRGGDTQDSKSKAGWASKERSTPEGYNREEHAWRFEYHPYLPGTSPASMLRAYTASFKAPVVVRPPKNKKTPEERKAARERKNMQNERASLHHVQTALHKYNRANNTTFELDEITVKCQLFEFGPCLDALRKIFRRH
ncbi:unnamed protein product [Urochloa decumbens]|uniref:Uncharacterized protein n=1 Tax=Urochloa decumbens TaxID=240449 RepID=A0ABC8VLU7_9POAL